MAWSLVVVVGVGAAFKRVVPPPRLTENGAPKDRAERAPKFRPTGRQRTRSGVTNRMGSDSTRSNVTMTLLAIRHGRRAARTSTFDSKLPAFDPCVQHANLTLTLSGL